MRIPKSDAPFANIRRIGMTAICSGTTSSATTATNSTKRPRNSIQENAYAANAAIVIGITVDGIATAKLFMNAFCSPPRVERLPVVVERPRRRMEGVRERRPPSRRVDEVRGTERRDQHTERGDQPDQRRRR